MVSALKKPARCISFVTDSFALHQARWCAEDFYSRDGASLLVAGNLRLKKAADSDLNVIDISSPGLRLEPLVCRFPAFWRRTVRSCGRRFDLIGV